MRSTASEVSTGPSNPGLIPGMVIDSDRPCPKCGYNVRSLAIGQPCPECGKPIYFGLQAIAEHPLADAPYWYLRLTQAALWGLFASSFAAPGLWAARSLLRSGLPVALLGVSAVWVASLVALSVTRPPERADGAAMPQIDFWKRALAVGSQSLWPVAALLAMLAPGATWAESLLPWTLLAASAGLFPTMMFMADVAEFAGDPDRGRRMTIITLVMLVLTALAAVGIEMRVSIPLPSVSALVKGVALLPFFLTASGLLLIWHFFQLAVVGNWAIQVARREDERVERLRERFKNERMQGALSLDNEPFGGPVQAPVGSMMGLRPNKRG